MIEGQCLCGIVKYQYHGEIEKTIICYCKDCQMALCLAGIVHCKNLKSKI